MSFDAVHAWRKKADGAGCSRVRKWQQQGSQASGRLPAIATWAGDCRLLQCGPPRRMRQAPWTDPFGADRGFGARQLHFGGDRAAADTGHVTEACQ